MKKYAASRYLLQIKMKEWPGTNDCSYSYFDERSEAVQYLIELQTKRIQNSEHATKTLKSNLAKFIKKESRNKSLREAG